MRTPDELTTLFRENGLKVTPQRRAVFDALHRDATHPTADVIFARLRATMPTVSLRTVYQALNDLIELGEVQAVWVGNGAARFDPNTSHHDHFICWSCERIYDVAATRPTLVSAEVDEVDDTAGYVVDSAEIFFRGMCASCVA